MISIILKFLLMVILIIHLRKIRMLRLGYSDPVSELSRDIQQILNQICELDKAKKFNVREMQEEFRFDYVNGNLEALRQHRINLGIILSSLQ